MVIFFLVIICAMVAFGVLYYPGGYLNGPQSFDRRFAANRRPEGWRERERDNPSSWSTL